MMRSLPPAGGGTWDVALLAPIAEINEQLLECLRSMAADEPGTAAATLAPRLVQLTQPQWRRLDAGALRRLSSSPCLLLDAGFSQASHWQDPQSLAIDAVMDQPGQDVYFRGAAGSALLRRTLLLAWHVARSNRLMAGVVFGMNPAVAEGLARRRLKELEAMAERAPAWMMPRWERQPLVWRQMIDAACAGQPSTLRAMHMRGVQLLARERYPIC